MLLASCLGPEFLLDLVQLLQRGRQFGADRDEILEVRDHERIRTDAVLGRIARGSAGTARVLDPASAAVEGDQDGAVAADADDPWTGDRAECRPTTDPGVQDTDLGDLRGVDAKAG